MASRSTPGLDEFYKKLGEYSTTSEKKPSPRQQTGLDAFYNKLDSFEQPAPKPVQSAATSVERQSLTRVPTDTRDAAIQAGVDQAISQVRTQVPQAQPAAQPGLEADGWWARTKQSAKNFGTQYVSDMKEGAKEYWRIAKEEGALGTIKATYGAGKEAATSLVKATPSMGLEILQVLPALTNMLGDKLNEERWFEGQEIYDENGNKVRFGKGRKVPEFIRRYGANLSEKSETLYKTIEEKQQEMAREAGITEDMSPFHPTRFGYGVGMGAASLATAAVVTAATKNPVAGAATLGIIESQDTYYQAKEAHYNRGVAEFVAENNRQPDTSERQQIKDDAEAKAFSITGIEFVGITALEKVGLDALFRDYAGGVGRKMAINAITETAQEESQQVFSNMVAKYGYDETVGIFDGTAEVLITTPFVGAGGGLLFGSMDTGVKNAPKQDFNYALEAVKSSEGTDLAAAIEAGDISWEAVYKYDGKEVLTDEYAQGRINDVAQKLENYQDDLGKQYKARMLGGEYTQQQIIDAGVELLQESQLAQLGREPDLQMAREAREVAEKVGITEEDAKDVIEAVKESIETQREQFGNALQEAQATEDAIKLDIQDRAQDSSRDEIVQNLVTSGVVGGMTESRAESLTDEALAELKEGQDAIMDALNRAEEAVVPKAEEKVVVPSDKKKDLEAPTDAEVKKTKPVEVEDMTEREKEETYTKKEEPTTSAAGNDIDVLIQQYRDTGRVATRYPRKGTVSLNGGRAIPEAQAIEQMRNLIERESKVKDAVAETITSVTGKKDGKQQDTDTGSGVAKEDGAARSGTDASGREARKPTDTGSGKQESRGERGRGDEGSGKETERDVVEKLQKGEAVKATDMARAMGIEVVDKTQELADNKEYEEATDTGAGSSAVPDADKVPAGDDRGRSAETAGELSRYDEGAVLAESGNGYGGAGTTDVSRLTKKQRQTINEQAVQILELHEYNANPDEYTQEERDILASYSGSGGKESVGADGQGLLSEYYTPQAVVTKLWDIVDSFGVNIDNAFEPSAGTGRIIASSPNHITVDGAELSGISGTIAKILNRDSDITIGDFQDLFFDKKTGKQKPITKKYDLIIGNPPFGDRGGFIKGKGEEEGIGRWEEYFIKRGLDMANENGYVVYVINSSFLKKTLTKGKDAIARQGELIAAYRLPENIFEDTKVGTDIVVFQKSPTENEQTITQRLQRMSADNYFANNDEKVLGETKKRTDRFGKPETYVEGSLDDAMQRLEVKPWKGMPDIVREEMSVAEQLEEAAQENVVATPEPTKAVAVPRKQRQPIKPRKPQAVAKTKAKKSPLYIKPNKKARVVPSQDLSSRIGEEITDTRRAEIDALKNVDRSLAVPNPTDAQKEVLNFDGEKWYAEALFYSGDIYKNIEKLKSNKQAIVDAIGQDRYDEQLSRMKRVLPKQLGIEDIIFDPVDRHIGAIKTVARNGEESTVLADFVMHVRFDRNKISLSPRVRPEDITRYVRGETARKNTKNITGFIKADAKRLFNRYLQAYADKETQDAIVEKYNREKNSYVSPDYSAIPVEVKDMSPTFRGNEFRLSQTQKEGVSFLVHKGTGLIAYGVGAGKTHTLAVATKVNMDKGWTKRPLFIVPNATIEKTWIATINELFPGMPINNLGGLQAPVVRKLTAERGADPKNWIKDGEVSIISHEGILKLGIKEEEFVEVMKYLNDAMWSESKAKTERAGEKQQNEIAELIGRAQKYASDVDFSDLGFDHLAVDEVHNFRKIFQGAKPEKERANKRFRDVIGGTPSRRAQQLFILSQMVQSRNNNRNVFLASATPFENHATEVYNILSLVARDRLQEMGILNINDFFAVYSNFETELDRKLDGEWVNREKMKSFANLQSLQTLLREFIDYKVDKTLVRPERKVLTPHLGMSARQEQNLERIQMLLKGEKVQADGSIEVSSKNEKEEGAFLKASTYSVANSVSPYFIDEYLDGMEPTAEQIVEDSPKIKYALEVARTVKNNKNTSKFGTFIYIGKYGVKFHPALAEYFAEQLGYKQDEVAYISGNMNDSEKEAVKEAFNKGKVRVLLGGDQTKEGIDLQNNGFITVNVALGWNPTEVAQVEGRVWRQGNRRSITPLVYPLVENSGDATMYNKYEEKGGRINDIFSYAGTMFDVGEVDPAEKKLALLTNPEDKARLQIEINKAELEQEKVMLEGDIREVENLYADLRSAQSTEEQLETSKDSTYFSEDRRAEMKKEWQKAKRRVATLQERIKNKGIKDRESYTEKLNADLAAVQTRIAEINNTYPDLLDKFTEEYNEMVRNRKTIPELMGEVNQLATEVQERSEEEIAKIRQEKILAYEQYLKDKAEGRANPAAGGAFFQRVGRVRYLKSKVNGKMFGSVSEDMLSYVALEDIVVDPEGLRRAKKDMREGRKSYSSLPLYVEVRNEQVHLIDGHHRILEYIENNGERGLVEVMFDGAEYNRLADLEDAVNDAALAEKEARFQRNEVGAPQTTEKTARQQLEDYRSRLNLTFPVEFVDAIFTPEGGRALGVEYEGGMLLTKWLKSTSVDHEMVHKVVRHMHEMELFKDMNRTALLRAVNGGRDFSPADFERLNEKLAEGYEAYIAGRREKQPGIVMRFFERLKEILSVIHEQLGGENLGIIDRFYRKVAEGKNKNAVMELKAPVPARVSQTASGDIFVNFDFAAKQAAIDGVRQEFYQRFIERLDEDEHNVNRMRKDINTLEKLTMQSRDIYLKDQEEFAEAKAYERVADVRREHKQEIDNVFTEMIRPYFELKGSSQDKVSKVLMEGDMRAKEYTDAGLKRKNLNAEEIAAYKAVRKAFNAAHAVLIAEMRKHGVSEEEIAQYEAERDGYMPHKWKYRYVVKEQVFDEAKQKWVTMRIDDYKNKRQQKAAYEQKIKENQEAGARFVLDTLDNLDVDFFTQQNLSFEAMKDVISQSAAEGKTKAQMIDAIRNMFKEKGFGRHYIRRTGVHGYQKENVPELIANYFSGFSGYITKMEAGKQYYAILSNIDAKRQKKFYNWMRDMIAYDMGQSKEWSTVKAVSFAYYLANDISFLAVNATQNFIVGAGELSKYIEGAAGKALTPEARIVKAMSDWAVGNVSEEERDAVEGLLKKGELGGQMAAELIGFKNNPLYNTISSGFNKVMFSTTQAVESHVNRVPMFLAARRIFKDQGMTDKEANEMALEVSNDVHFRYGKQHRPEFMRGGKNVFFVFYHYMRSFTYQLYRDATQKEYASFARKMMWTAAFGGTTSLPFAKLFLILFGMVAGGYDDEDLEKEIEGWELLYKKGIPAYYGVDLSGRVGVEFLSVNQIAENPGDVRSYLGAAGGLAFKRFPEGVALLWQNRYMDATAKLLPDMVANPIKAWQGYEVGVRSFAGTPLETADGEVFKYNTIEAIIKATGFTPTRESLLWDAKSREWDMKDRVQAARSNVRREVRYLVQKGEYADARDVQARAIAEGIIDEDTDYVREFAKDRFMEEAFNDWRQDTSAARPIEEALIKNIYPEGATDQQRNNIRKEFAVYRVYGMDNKWVKELQSAPSNDDKVQILLKMRFDMGEDAFRDFFNKGRKEITLESGRKSEILISDDLMKKYLEARKN